MASALSGLAAEPTKNERASKVARPELKRKHSLLEQATVFTRHSTMLERIRSSKEVSTKLEQKQSIGAPMMMNPSKLVNSLYAPGELLVS